jgi:hypothetical protein
MNALIFVSIAQSVATALLQSQNSGNVAEWAGYLNLAASLGARLSAGTEDLQALDDQLRVAVAAGRGLTAEERAAWRARDDLATEVARRWLLDHPKSPEA